MIWYALWILFKAVRNLAGHKSFIFLLSVSTSLQSSTTTIVMPKTPSVTRSRTAAAMTSRRRDDQPNTSTDDSSATSSASSSRGRGRGRGRGKRGRASNKKDFSQQTLACKGCGQIGHTVLLCEEEVTSNELALTCTWTHVKNRAQRRGGRRSPDHLARDLTEFMWLRQKGLLSSADRARLMFARELPQLLNFQNFVWFVWLYSV